MCELFALSASEPVDVKLSLAELARHGGETGIHADGWGVAFFDGRDAHLFREPAAAASSPWIECLQEHPVRSSTVIAHIRHRTLGVVSLANTQPFVRELWGQTHVFAHNGDLEELPTPAGRFQLIGETDSEAAFCLLLERWASRSDPRTASRDLMRDVFVGFVREMRVHGPANIICASDGRLFVHADRRTQRLGVIEPPGMWMLERACDVPGGADLGTGVEVAGSATHVVLFASVPLTHESWRPLEQGSVFTVENGKMTAFTRDTLSG